MVKLILFLLCFRIDNDPTIVDTFSIIEVNHHYNDYGVEVWSQLICWDWHGKKSVFRVQHWIMMKDAYKKTKEGREKWDKKVKAWANKIRNWEDRQNFLNNSSYRGDFVGGKYYPFKDFKTGYWEVKFLDKNIPRMIRSKNFIETYTLNDRETEDRKNFPISMRRGLTQIGEKKFTMDQEWREFVDRLVPQFHQ